MVGDYVLFLDLYSNQYHAANDDVEMMCSGEIVISRKMKSKYIL